VVVPVPAVGAGWQRHGWPAYGHYVVLDSNRGDGLRWR